MAGTRFGLPSVDLLAQFWNQPLDYEAPPPDRQRPRTISGRLLTVAVIVVIGMLLAVAWRESVLSQPADAQARQDLRDDIAAQREDNAVLSDFTERLRDDVNALRDELLGGQAVVEQLHMDEAAAGLRAVTGDGAKVVVADGPKADDGGPQLGEIFDRDLHLIVNTLWALGAEAIAIDGQRLTAVTTIRAAGEVILVDFAPVNSPYEIVAIGPGGLADDFGESATAETFRQYATDYGIALTVEAVDDVVLPAASPPLLNDATPKD